MGLLVLPSFVVNNLPKAISSFLDTRTPASHSLGVHPKPSHGAFNTFHRCAIIPVAKMYKCIHLSSRNLNKE